MKNRYAIHLMTHDAEPQYVARVLWYCPDISDVQATIAEYLGDTDLNGAYLAVYDREIEEYIEA